MLSLPRPVLSRVDVGQAPSLPVDTLMVGFARQPTHVAITTLRKDVAKVASISVARTASYRILPHSTASYHILPHLTDSDPVKKHSKNAFSTTHHLFFHPEASLLA